MKANELMIGDWVKTPKGSFKVTDIQDNDVIATDYNNGEGADSLFFSDEIEPIPLTAEILDKNGFNYDEDRKAYLMGVIFRVKPQKYSLFSLEICGCPYPLSTVHQLQHALRLCGIEKEIEL